MGLDAGGSVDLNCIHDMSILKEYTEGNGIVIDNNNRRQHHVKRVTTSFGQEIFDDATDPDGCNPWNR